MSKKRFSLYRRAATLSSLILAVVSVTLGSAAWYFASNVAGSAYDKLLIGAAFEIAETVSVRNGIVSVNPPVSAFSILSLAPEDRIFYNVEDVRGGSLTGYADLVGKLDDGLQGPHLYDQEYLGTSVRVATVGKYVSDPEVSGWVKITVAQTLDARWDTTRDQFIKALSGIAILTILTICALLAGIRFALMPLARIEKTLQSRASKDLEALNVSAPIEVEALVHSINLFLERLSARISIMERFIADAAHQIKTPLTALTSQLDLIYATSDILARNRHLERIRERTLQLNRLTSQLLNHAMVIHRQDAIPFALIDFNDLVRETLSEAVRLRWDYIRSPDQKKEEVDISFLGEDFPLFVEGDQRSLREALNNVLHNSFKYGVRDKLIVNLKRGAKCVVLEIMDDGPGIPREKWAHLGQPFIYQSNDGSGLGLAIAWDVVKAHGGYISFRYTETGMFAVVMSIPWSDDTIKR